MAIGLLSVSTIGSFGKSLASNSKERLKCLSLNNRPCQARLALGNINSGETSFFSIYY